MRRGCKMEERVCSGIFMRVKVGRGRGGETGEAMNDRAEIARLQVTGYRDPDDAGGDKRGDDVCGGGWGTGANGRGQ